MKLPFKLDSLQGLSGPAGARALLTQGPLLVSILCAGAIAAQLAATAWKFLPGGNTPAAGAPAAAAVTRAAAVFDLNSILAAQLFGAPGAVSGGGDAPQTQMALVLAGTIATSEPDHGFAILGESAQTARMYSIGANLPGGAKLHQVFPDRVILDRGGALESLLLPRQNLAGAGITPGSPPPAMPTASAEAPDSSVASSVRRIIAQDPEVVGEVLRPQPVFDKGQLRGYRIYPGRDREKFARLGLQPGDLVTQINGNPLTDPSQGMQIMQGLGHGDRVTVTVERGGQSQQMVVDTAKIASVAGADAQPATP